MSTQYVYVMKGLSKNINGKQILKETWLSFLPGAKIGIIGHNGAGKSTLLRILAGEDKVIGPEILSSRILEHGESEQAHATFSGGMKGLNTSGSLKDALEELEIIMIREGLKRCGFNKSRLAKELGISRAGLIMKVEKYGLDKRMLKRAVGE